MSLPKIINCSGFAQTGCTAQVDILRQYHSIAGFVEPYNEFGVLKSPYSFGGLLIAKINRHNMATKNEIRLYMLGDPALNERDDRSLGLYLGVVRRLAEQVGDSYETVTNQAIDMIPENLQTMDFDQVFQVVKDSFGFWIDGVRTAMKAEHWKDAPEPDIERILGLKNDPTGAMPLLTGLYPEGSISSAIIRDPRDTNMDFNRHYGLGHSKETVTRQCSIYRSQVNSCIHHIKNYRDRFDGRYFIVEFERLVNEEDYRESYVQRMIGTRPKIRSTFDPEISQKNVGLYKNHDPELVEIAASNCMDLYTDFLKLVESEGLLHKV